MLVLFILLILGTKSSWTADKAKYPLFSYVTREVLDRPTFAKFISLDNYESSTGTSELLKKSKKMGTLSTALLTQGAICNLCQ